MLLPTRRVKGDRDGPDNLLYLRVPLQLVEGEPTDKSRSQGPEAIGSGTPIDYLLITMERALGE